MRIGFMGNGKWACETLRELVARGVDVAGVVCETDNFDSKEKEYCARLLKCGLYESLKATAEELNLPVYQPEDVNSKEFLTVVDSLKPQLIVVVSYHSILKKDILSKYTVINAHGAPLPFYRGRAPIVWAIINGEKETGVTVHYVNEGVDTGDILVQEKIPIHDDDTALDVFKRSLEYYPRIVTQAIELIKSGKVNAKPQDPFSGSYFPKRKPEDGKIDWSWNSKDIYNWVRALTFPYPGAFTMHKEKKIYVWEASLPTDNHRVSPVSGIVFGRAETGKVKVTTGDGYIFLDQIQYDGEGVKPADTIPQGAILGF